MVDRFVRAALAAAPVTAAAGLAVWSLGFGLPYLFRPDEEVMIGRSVHLVLDHSLDPLFAIYPPLAFYVFAGAAAIAGLFHPLGPATRVDPTAAYLAGRAVSALAFVAAVAFVSATARARYGWAGGLVGGACLALAPLAVRQAHFATTDAVAMAFVAAAIWAGDRAAGARGFLLAGVLAGLAAGTRYTAGLVAVVPLALALLGDDRWRRAATVLAGSAVAFAGVVALAGHPADYVRGLAFLGGRATQQYGTPIGLVYHPTVSLPYGLGFGGYALALAGTVLALARRRPLDVALLAYLAASVAVIGFSHEVFWRYALLLLPALCLLAGGLARLARSRQSRRLGVAAALVLLAPSAYASVMTDRLLGAEDTRQQAAEWLLRNAPAGSELRIGNYWGQPFYDASELEDRPLHPLYLTGNPIADSFEQGRFTDRFVVNRPGSGTCFALAESGPPWQAPLPATPRPPVAVFSPGGDPRSGRYDPLDSFFLPVWGFDDLQRPGPAIAIVEGC
jgi:Dolichyl-phosphate-mannose-protein mannosyltransferase